MNSNLERVATHVGSFSNTLAPDDLVRHQSTLLLIGDIRRQTQISPGHTFVLLMSFPSVYFALGISSGQLGSVHSHARNPLRRKSQGCFQISDFIRDAQLSVAGIPSVRRETGQLSRPGLARRHLRPCLNFHDTWKGRMVSQVMFWEPCPLAQASAVH